MSSSIVVETTPAAADLVQTRFPGCSLLMLRWAAPGSVASATTTVPSETPMSYAELVASPTRKSKETSTKERSSAVASNVIPVYVAAVMDATLPLTRREPGTYSPAKLCQLTETTSGAVAKLRSKNVMSARIRPPARTRPGIKSPGPLSRRESVTLPGRFAGNRAGRLTTAGSSRRKFTRRMRELPLSAINRSPVASISSAVG